MGNKMKAMTSTYHLKMKLSTEHSKKIITTKPNSDRPLRERDKTQQKSILLDDRGERERYRGENTVVGSELLVGGGTAVDGAPIGGGRWVCNERETKAERQTSERERNLVRDGRRSGYWVAIGRWVGGRHSVGGAGEREMGGN
jgi:hypothetical protein